jgi:hypothetical protein
MLSLMGLWLLLQKMEMSPILLSQRPSFVFSNEEKSRGDCRREGIFGTDKAFERLLETAQYDRIRGQRDVPIINLELVERDETPWRYGSIAFPKLLKEYEYINVPTMKTHLQTTVSLRVKNRKGLIPMKSRKIFLKKDLHSYLLELSHVVQPSLTLADALYCIEGTCAFCIGDCPTKPSKKIGLPLIKGCPPDYREIVDFLFPGTSPDFGRGEKA